MQTLFCGSPVFVSRCFGSRVGKAGYTVNRSPNQQSFNIQYESFLYLEQVKRDQKLIYTVAGRKKRGGVSDTLIADVVCTFDGVGCTFNVVDSTADVVDFIQ